jgi:mono/diheme cytochrome c family protein
MWRSVFSGVAVAAAIIAAAFFGPAAQGQEQQQQTLSESDIADGMRLYQQKGNCQACHGWAGDGRKMDSQMPDGANLREIPLDREALIKTVKCGRPGTGMPYHDQYAYTDKRCYGVTREEVGKDMPLLGEFLQPREIDAVVKYLFAKAVGHGPATYEDCVEFWGRDTRQCEPMKK